MPARVFRAIAATAIALAAAGCGGGFVRAGDAAGARDGAARRSEAVVGRGEADAVRREAAVGRGEAVVGPRDVVVESDSIPVSLTGRPGDPVRGRALVVDRRAGMCLLCHAGPFPEERFQGDIGPSLAGVGARLSAGQLRLRIVDTRRISPASPMPSYYRIDGLQRVGRPWEGKTVFDARQIEDVVAFLLTLRGDAASAEGSDAPSATGVAAADAPADAARRRLLAAGAGAGLLLTVRPAAATPESMAAAIREFTGGAPVREGKVRLEVPQLVENGNVVPVSVSVADPAAPGERALSLAVFNELNPQPNVATFEFGPRSGPSRVAFRMRMAESQRIVAIAKLADGSCWSAGVDVIVTLAACLE